MVVCLQSTSRCSRKFFSLHSFILINKCNMKLLTHNFMTSKCLKRVNVGFPLGIVAKEVKEIKVDFNAEFISRMVPKLDWDVLCASAESLGHLNDLPKTLPSNYENDEEFLRKAHHVMCEVELVWGDLVCPETGVTFPVSDGIPNMLANEDEVLYTFRNNFRAQKALIAAKYSGTEIKVPSDFALGVDNNTPEFLKKFPNGKVPALETPDKKYISESNAIAFYVGNDELNGKNKQEQTEILMWINFGDSDILPAACTWLFPCLGIMQYNKQSADKAKEEIKRIFGILNDHLLTKTYLVGERITQADISLVCILKSLFEDVLDAPFRLPYRNVTRWFLTCVNQPQFHDVLGAVILCSKPAQFDAKKYAEIQKKLGHGQPAKAKEVKDAAPKSEPKSDKKKKEQKPKKEEPAAEEPDETELALAQEPKSKDPFEKFPKGSFNMDEFKRVYSNEDESVSIKYFFEKFDAENYSIWYSEYLFPTELTLVFMSCNLISGMFQRLDKMRKNAFGSVCLFGEDNNNTISGIWVWRGHELAFTLSEDWQIDYESYSWKKLDPTSPETKKMITEYLSWSGDFDGKKFNQGKIFK